MFFFLIPGMRYPRSLETVELAVKLPGFKTFKVISREQLMAENQTTACSKNRSISFFFMCIYCQVDLHTCTHCGVTPGLLHFLFVLYLQKIVSFTCHL